MKNPNCSNTFGCGCTERTGDVMEDCKFNKKTNSAIDPMKEIEQAYIAKSGVTPTDNPYGFAKFYANHQNQYQKDFIKRLSAHFKMGLSLPNDIVNRMAVILND